MHAVELVSADHWFEKIGFEATQCGALVVFKEWVWLDRVTRTTIVIYAPDSWNRVMEVQDKATIEVLEK